MVAPLPAALMAVLSVFVSLGPMYGHRDGLSSESLVAFQSGAIAVFLFHVLLLDVYLYSASLSFVSLYMERGLQQAAGAVHILLMGSVTFLLILPSSCFLCVYAKMDISLSASYVVMLSAVVFSANLINAILTRSIFWFLRENHDAAVLLAMIAIAVSFVSLCVAGVFVSTWLASSWQGMIYTGCAASWVLLALSISAYRGLGYLCRRRLIVRVVGGG